MHVRFSIKNFRWDPANVHVLTPATFKRHHQLHNVRKHPCFASSTNSDLQKGDIPGQTVSNAHDNVECLGTGLDVSCVVYTDEEVKGASLLSGRLLFDKCHEPCSVAEFSLSLASVTGTVAAFGSVLLVLKHHSDEGFTGFLITQIASPCCAPWTSMNSLLCALATSPGTPRRGPESRVN